MKILLVYYDIATGPGGQYYEGIASISSSLKSRGHEVRFFHIVDKIDSDAFMTRFESDFSDVDIVGCSTTTHAFPVVAGFMQAMKSRYADKPVICGGVHPTVAPDEAINTPGIDVICIGDGEIPFMELCERMEGGLAYDDVAGLWIKRGDEIIKNPVRCRVANLDELASPDRKLFEWEKTSRYLSKSVIFMASRGCPFKCTYCSNHALKAATDEGGGPYVRFKSVERIISEIEDFLAGHAEVEQIHFDDDILTLRKSWFKEFAETFKRRIGLPYSCNVRFDLLSEESVTQLAESGAREVRVGLESGDDYIRNEVMKRRQERGQILRAAKWLNDRKIGIYAYTIVGLPFETLKRCLETVKLTALLKPVFVQNHVFYPYPGTVLYQVCRDEGFLSERKVDSFFDAGTVLDLPTFTPDKINFARKYFYIFVGHYRNVFKKPQPLRFILEKGLDFMWLHPGIFTQLNRVYQYFRKRRVKG